MNKLIIGLFLTVLITAKAFAIEIDMTTKVDAVTVYHSGALVMRLSNTELKPGLNELVFKNLSSKIVLNSLKVSNKEVTVLNKSIIRKLTAEEFDQLMDQKMALNKQMTLIETKYNEPGFVDKVEDLEKMTDFYSKKILELKKSLREVERQIEEAKKIENIQLDNEDAAILKLVVSVDGKLKDPFKLQYVCGGIGWSPAYDMVVESSGDKTIEVKYLAKIMSQTGEDWEDVKINLSSSFPLESPTKLPNTKTPWVITSNGFDFYNQSNNDQDNENNEQQQIDQLEGVEYQEINVPSFLKLRTLKDKYSIQSNSTVFTFPIQTFKLPANYYYYAVPVLDNEVYLVAEVTGWDTLGFVDGVANITYMGNDVGKFIIKFSEVLDTLVLPVGKDNSVYLKRSEIADQKYFKSTNIGKKQKTTLAYQFVLKNNNPFPVHFQLFDQVPISQTKSAEVDIEKTSGGILDKETGEITWVMDINQGQTIEKELVFNVVIESGSTNQFQYHRYRTRFKKRGVYKY